MTDTDFTLPEELLKAFEDQGISYKEPTRKIEILSEIQAKFIIGNPRAWWISLSTAPTVRTFHDNTGHLHLCKLAPDHSGDIWFIIDEDNEEKLIFSAPLNKIPSVLENCRFFEYYIVDKDLKWIIAENDHGDLLLSQADSTQPLITP